MLAPFVLLPLVSGWARAEIPGWPADVREVSYKSPADKSLQPALFWSPAGPKKQRPLLVGLHTWSADYRQTGSSLAYLAWCKQQGWIFIHPNFRGRNRTAAALGSDLAVADVVGAVEYAKSQAAVDSRRIYLIGASGGGHMALLMAGRHPEIWAGVSSWVPISDLAAWHRQSTENTKFLGYAKQMEMALGGPPETDKARAESARHRSPITWLARAQKVPLDINAGVHDGRTGSVPFSHSLVAFNCLAAEADRLPPAEIETYYRDERLPCAWQPASPDPLYGQWRPLFRKVSGNARVTIFEGGHQIIHEPALNWLAQQCQGKPAVWNIKNPVKLVIAKELTQSGK
jgi:pimeloyl-ACP methyl ester carboxylesterase